MEPVYNIHRYPTQLIRSVVLGNGRRVTLRPVLPQDADLECEFVAALSLQSRRNRFHAAVNGLGALQATRMTNIDYRGHMAFVASVIEGEGDEEQERLVADARYAVAEDGETAEFAIVVADGWAGLGLAQRLLAMLGDCARRAGLRWLRGEVLAANQRMLALMKHCGFSVSEFGDDDDLMVAERRLEAPRAPVLQPPSRVAALRAAFEAWWRRPAVARG